MGRLAFCSSFICLVACVPLRGMLSGWYMTRRYCAVQMGFTSIGGHNVDGFAASDSRMMKSTKSAAATKHPYQLPVVPGFAVPTPVKAKKLGGTSASATASEFTPRSPSLCCLSDACLCQYAAAVSFLPSLACFTCTSLAPVSLLFALLCD